MASFTNYHSLYVSALTTPFWRSLLDSIAADANSPRMPANVHGMLLNTLVEKLGNKPGTEEDQDCEDEFADKEEYARFWGQAKAKFLEIARKLSGAGPLEVRMRASGKGFETCWGLGVGVGSLEKGEDEGVGGKGAVGKRGGRWGGMVW
eukprot:571341-Rhodomonas_salina.2